MTLMAPSPQVTQALQDAKQRLQLAFGERLREVRLFGSMARGTANEHSDVDVLVLLSGEATYRDVTAATAVVVDAGLDRDLIMEALVLGQAQLDRLRQHGRLIAENIDRDSIPI